MIIYISLKCLLTAKSSEICEECEIPIDVVEMLQLDDSAWESSLDAIWCRMAEANIAQDIIAKAKSCIEAAELTLTESSLDAIWFRMAEANIAQDFIAKAKSCIEAAELTVEGLRTTSMAIPCNN
jgi:hypothetical protein